MFFKDVRLAGQSNADARQASRVPQNFSVYWANLLDLFAGCFPSMFQRRWDSPCAAAVTGDGPLIMHADNITESACGAQTCAS